MSEQTIIEGIQDVVQSIDGFAVASVVISDWGVLDGSTANAPFFIIDISDEWSSEYGLGEPQTIWNIISRLFVAFDDWDDSYSELRDKRQDIIDAFNAVGTARSAGGIDGVDIQALRAGTGIEEWHLQYNDEDDPVPVFLTQALIFEVVEYG